MSSQLVETWSCPCGASLSTVIPRDAELARIVSEHARRAALEHRETCRAIGRLLRSVALETPSADRAS